MARAFRDHESDHPHDRTVPILLAGGAVATGELAPFSSLLDVPATVLWAFGAPVPRSYAGRPLVEAFAPRDDVSFVAPRAADDRVGATR